MQSVSLLRFLQILVVLTQLGALTLFGDLCTGFESAQSCAVDKQNATSGIQRHCLQFGITDLRSLFSKAEPWKATHYVSLYTGIWILLVMADLIFAVLFCLEKQSSFQKNASFKYSLFVCILELCVLCTQIFGAVHVYNSWNNLWSNEYYQPRLPLNFHVGFFIAATCLLMVVFEEFVSSPRLYFVRREEDDSVDEANDVQTYAGALATARSRYSTDYTSRSQNSFSTATN